MKRLLIIVFLIGSIPTLYSQNSSDALRYSRILYGGTARFQGLGGALGAVGADFSTIATNPAGLGLYTSSEVTFTPSLRMENSSSDFSTETNRENKFNVGMDNLGLVFHIGNDKGNTGFRGINIAFGMNRQNDYNNRIFMQGVNNKSSLLTQYVNILNNTPGGVTPQMIDDQYPFDIALAYNANFIYLADSANLIYANDAPKGGLIQSKLVTTEGSINEFDIAFGTNYNDRLYLGATIGIPMIRYYENTQYQEIKNDTSVHYFHSMTFNQQLETHGTGINLKVGIIYRPADWVRIGAAIHTPTYYGTMRDSWNSSMEGGPGDANPYSTSKSSPLGSFEYQLTTPFRFIGSVAFIIGKYGLVSGEYEYVNYSQSSLAASGVSFSDVNTDIKNKYKAPLNVRFGTEWRIQNFLLRGGFGYYGSPYQAGINTSEMVVASLGWGYRVKHFFFDMAYRWSQSKEDYYFYDSSLVSPSQNKYTTGAIIASVGLRF